MKSRKDEKAFDVIRPSKGLSRLIASKTRHISRMLYLSVLSAVSHHGLENEIYFKCSSLEINSFASWLKKRGIFHISCTCLSWGLIVYFTTGLRVHLMDFIGIRWIPSNSIRQMDSDEVHRSTPVPYLIFVKLPVPFRVMNFSNLGRCYK